MKMLCLKDFESYAQAHLPSATWAFYSMGSEREDTMKDNQEAYRRYKFIPRILGDIGSKNLSVRVLGDEISLPVALAPTAYQRLAHPDGEIAAAKAAATMGTVYTLSTVATTSLEDIAAAVPNSLRWMQIYVVHDRNITDRMIRKAAEHGYKALVLTVDTPVTGLHIKSWKDELYIPPHLSVPNMEECALSPTSASIEGQPIRHLVSQIGALSWDDVKWIRSISKLPLVFKGVLTVEDAKLAVQHGASAVWISNHGGRQLDGTPATIDVLKSISDSLRGTDCEIYVDGGIRWGTDILKALCLGARAVFIGRPILWGLAYDGEYGVQKVLEILKSEMIRAMTILGCRNISELGPQYLQSVPFAKI